MMSQHWHILLTKVHSLGVTLSVVHTMGLNKCVMARNHHVSTTQNRFILPSNSVPPIIFPSLPQTQSFRNLISEVTFHHFCHILFIRVNRFSQYSKERHEYQEAEVMGRRGWRVGVGTHLLHQSTQKLLHPWNLSSCSVHSGYSQDSHRSILFPSLQPLLVGSSKSTHGLIVSWSCRCILVMWLALKVEIHPLSSTKIRCKS